MEIMVKMMDVILAAAAVIGSAGTIEVQRTLGEYTPPGELRYVETEAVQEENELVFGNLAIELPEGVYARIEATDDTDQGERQLVSLEGAESIVGEPKGYQSTGPFPPQIGLAHYTAEYESEEALIRALLEMYPGGNLRSLYGNGQNNEYVFRIGRNIFEENYYTNVIVCGEDLYLVGEYKQESGYSFSALREQGKVKWQDSDRAVECSTGTGSAYFMVTPEEGTSFLCHDCISNLFFYLDGYYDSSYASYETGREAGYIYSNALVDINFDGCTDIMFYRNTLIWDTVKRDYISVGYPEDMPDMYSRRSFPETKTIWGFDKDYLSETYSEDNVDCIESLWQWDGFVPVKKRECRAEVREDSVRIWAYEGTIDHILFDESFTPEEWDDKDNENIRVLYRQFYDGFVPEDFSVPEEPHDGDGQEMIPQGLLDQMADAMLRDLTGGTVSKMLTSMLRSSRLTDEECYEAARVNTDIRENILLSYHAGGGYVLIRADVDNDGTEDILGEFYWGGSGGYTSYILFQGQADGTYIETDSSDAMSKEFGVIEYDGKNYFFRTIHDYGRKFYSGFDAAVYEEGQWMEDVLLTLYAEDYELTLSGSEEGYETLAERVMEEAVSYDSLVEKYEVIVGSAEKPAEDNKEYPYMCDLDNDGEIEYYQKYIWTSNRYTEDTLAFYCEDEDDEGIVLLREAMRERRKQEDDYYNDIMFWADEADGETVVNVMYRTGLYDFVIVGYVIGGSECRVVYEIIADAVYGVKQTRNYWK